MSEMSDSELLRYNRHILLPAIDIAGQEKIHAARVLVVGAGGLGSPVAMYLAASGIGTLVLADNDTVDLHNLQRQIVHTTQSLGMAKVDSAAITLHALNPHCNVIVLNTRLAGDELRQQVALAGVVVDCSDNFATRFALNATCVEQQKPLVSGAAIRMEGQLAVFDARRADSPCYRCLYQEEGDDDMSCSTNGVLAPLVGVIGSLQAIEVLKLVTGCGEAAVGKLLVFDAATMDMRTLLLKKDNECAVCGKA